MFVPKKLVEYNFSYPKRKPKKSAQEKKEEKLNPEQEVKKINYPQYNPNVEVNQQEEEDFWVDCQK